ncbi:hypothetical protein ACPC54_18590 [Kitasatospora sp. NPDC094028]
MSSTTDVIRILGVNCQQGRSRDQLCDWIDQLTPAVDAIMWHEAIIGDPAKGIESDWAAVSKRLDMDAYPTAPNHGRNKVNVIFLRREGRLVFEDAFDHPRPYGFLAPANLTVRLRRPDNTLARRPISLVSGHAPYQSATGRFMEAEWLTGLFKHGLLGYGHHDWNSYRTSGRPATSLHTVKDRPFAANRSVLTDDGVHVADDRPDRHLRYAGLVDVGIYAANELGQAGADGGTAGYGHQTRLQRGVDADVDLAVCIDRGYAVLEMAKTLVAGGVIDTPELRGASDHLPVDAQFSYAQLLAAADLSDEEAEYIVH